MDNGKGALPYLKVVGNFSMIDLFFLHFSVPFSSYFMPNSILLTPSFST